jgi:hypothetical protein
LTPTQEKGFRGLHLKAVRQVSELTSQLRTTVDFEGTKLIHEIVGVDMAAALPDHSLPAPATAVHVSPPPPTPEPEPDPARIVSLRWNSFTTLHEGPDRLVMIEKYESEQAHSEHSNCSALADLLSAMEGKLSRDLTCRSWCRIRPDRPQKGAL